MQVSLFVCATALFAAGIWLGYVRGVGTSTVAFATGVLCLVFAFLSRFKRFKGLGIEAELWEQKQEEAANLITTLRALAIVAAEQLVALNARMGRWNSGTSRRDLFSLADRLERILGEVEVSPIERERVKGDLYKYTAIDMALPIKKKIDSAIHKKVAEQQQILKSFGSPITDIEGHRKAAERLSHIEGQKPDWDQVLQLSPSVAMFEMLERTISATDCLSEKERSELRGALAEEMADLREWVTARRLRRPHVWLNQETE